MDGRVIEYYLPLDALWVGERHLGQLLVGHDLLHLGGGELAAAEFQAEPVRPQRDTVPRSRRRPRREVELPDEAVHGEAPGVTGQRRGGRLPRGVPLDALPPLAAVGGPEADPAAGVVGALLRLVLAAVGAVGLDAAPAAVPFVVAVVGGVEPVQPLQVQVRVEQVIGGRRAAGAGAEVAPPGLHLGRQELVLPGQVPERHVAAGAAVRLARRQPATTPCADSSMHTSPPVAAAARWAANTCGGVGGSPRPSACWPPPPPPPAPPRTSTPPSATTTT